MEWYIWHPIRCRKVQFSDFWDGRHSWANRQPCVIDVEQPYIYVVRIIVLTLYRSRAVTHRMAIVSWQRWYEHQSRILSTYRSLTDEWFNELGCAHDRLCWVLWLCNPYRQADLALSAPGVLSRDWVVNLLRSRSSPCQAFTYYVNPHWNDLLETVT